MKNFKFFLIATVAFVLLVVLLQPLFIPKYISAIRDGALIAEYYNSTKAHEVIFLGDCEVYENISPVTLFEEYGITSYIRGGPQQLIWQSYYLLEDVFRYESPRVVVFNVLAMKYGEPQSEPYNRLNLDGMSLSWSKLGAVRASMMEGEDLLSYLLPILRYHERWKELTQEDINYYFRQEIVGYNGFLMHTDVKPVTVIPEAPRLTDYTLSERCWEYLDKMRKLCGENNTELVLIKAPTIWPPWYEQWEEQIKAYAFKHGLKYINYLKRIDDLGIDFNADTYDGGLHLNVYGAEKFSRGLGDYLIENFELNDYRNDPQIQAEWSVILARYNSEKEKEND